jgi:hypothetical protein
MENPYKSPTVTSESRRLPSRVVRVLDLLALVFAFAPSPIYIWVMMWDPHFTIRIAQAIAISYVALVGLWLVSLFYNIARSFWRSRMAWAGLLLNVATFILLAIYEYKP